MKIIVLSIKFLIYFASTLRNLASLNKPLEQDLNEDHPSVLFMENPNTHEYELVDLNAQIIEHNPLITDVFYYLHTRDYINGVRIVSVEDTIDVFDQTKPTIFIIHGWSNNHASPVCYLITNAILSKYDVNVFCVDWGVAASKNYRTAKNSVVKIGKFISDFVNELINHYKIDTSSITLIGHSLGAHISGNIGADLNGTIPHIIGLDPAGPLFTYSNKNNRLDASDAVFVEVIHTCGYLLGFTNAIGDSDYFPNGGNFQPGCGRDVDGTCGHRRAYEYFAESIYSNDGFVCYECPNMRSFKQGKCYDNNVSVMGDLFIKKAKGTYYLDTNSKAPFAKG